MKHIKMLGLVALSAMALMALWGTASASASSFTSNGPVGKALTSTTVNQHIFTVTGSQVKCNSSVFNGVTEGTKTEGDNVVHGESQIVHPEYTNCEAFGFAANVNTEGCDYTFKSNTDANGMATVSIIDHSANEPCNGIVITADPIFTTCTAVVPKQSLSNAVSYTNNTGTIRVKATATGITTNVNVSNGACPLTTGVHSTANGNAATYNGESNITASGGVTWTA